MANKGQRMVFEDDYQYLKDLKENYPDPTDIGGSDYTAGNGISIDSDNEITVNLGDNLTFDNRGRITTDWNVLATDNQGNLNQPLTTNNNNGYSIRTTYGGNTYTSKFAADSLQVTEPYYSATYGTTRIDFVLDQFNDQHYPTININAGQPGLNAITHITIPHNPTAGTTVNYTLATTDDIITSYNDLTDKPTIPDAVSGTNDGTNWTSLTIGNDTYDIPQGGGSSYIFTNGLTENNGTVTNDLFTKIKTSLDGNPNLMNFQLSYSRIAMGQNAQSRGTESVAIGASAGAWTQGVAIGANATVNNYKSIGIGYQAVTSTTKTGQTVLGNKNAIDNDSSFIFADGDNNPTNPNLAVIKTDGTIVSKNLPAAPTTAGTYTLQCTVDAQGNITYSWV